ncbi:MAG TPA: Crp/Fnr family transcriptional regulator [Candidatus Binataceae bacterium]|jgi:CRP-like cAMP-binding protein|nr:Crp/Fnr family transcriptional regulator [Candidatus Binataceae bacterium]
MAVLNSLTEEGNRALWRIRQAGLPAEFVDELIGDNLIARYAKRFRLFLQGAPADVLMLIINGVVKVHCTQPDGRRFMVELAGPGDLIGYVDLLDARGRHCQAFEAQALTNCAVALITRQRILKLIEAADHSLLVSLFERLNSFWAATVHHYASLMTLSYRERLEAKLAEVASRFGVRDARGTMLTLELGHDDWADMIGSSRPMVSRLIAEMIENTVLAREGKHYILLGHQGLDKPSFQLPRAEAETAGRRSPMHKLDRSALRPARLSS